MGLFVRIQDNRVDLMKGDSLIGVITLDRLAQVERVTIEPTTSPQDADLIVRLAASHVAQYVVERSIWDCGVLRERISPLSGCEPERSHELLSFNAIAPEHADLSVEELVSVMSRVGVRVVRR